MANDEPPRARTLAQRVLRLGRIGWAVVGIAAAGFVVYSAVSTLSGLAIPLVVAAVLGVLLKPVVDWLERRRVARGLGSAAVLVVLAAVLGVAVWLSVVGIVDQSTRIADRLAHGLRALSSLGHLGGTSMDLSVVDLRNVTSAFEGGVASVFGTVFSSVAAFAVGTFVAVFFLFYVMADWPRIDAVVARHASIGARSGREVVDEAATTMRRYFGAMTSSNLVAAVLIGVSATLLGVPLAGSIALVTFVTSYVPFLGAIFSGAFAVLIALGSQGPTQALILLVVILVMQNVVQTLILTKMSSDRLRLHPIVNLGSTIVGAVLAGLLGATLSAPITVVLRDILGHARGASSEAPATGSAAADPAVPPPGEG